MNNKFQDMKFPKQTVETYKAIIKQEMASELVNRKF